ncbi:hypothetical protein HanXRQr2_Chr06g0262891 [Helianthus annuus]|uniref:Uncharacterized protein n=1 Tax=Helianthus annuus TaxID=4232 RepID=A0A9K3ITM6_HELAN|nr:hypothetical protein HanXRQr2_Chr06g0262891 [Helianthus annuus]KAJ0560813.1 hypothetical protein HanHA300_Chr06g0215631 [Helianthus annuus]KAJ0573850.1 hypothetical protein HanHA89_Chr06g0231411 [Helianthus annuus]KAJ0738185.1 hypothetical protein HanLR1_Chr06g0215341 [Helianthus annuus]KAJ0915754.1 hypothetical protein HanPSC8_Chr06g0253551 [Helianthus annuus]
MVKQGKVLLDGMISLKSNIFRYKVIVFSVGQKRIRAYWLRSSNK